MNVLQALTDFLPILVIHRTLLGEIVDMGLNEAPLFLIERTLAGLSTRRRSAGSTGLTTNCRTTTSGSHCPTARDAIVGLRNLVLHFGGRLGHRCRLIGIGTNRELLDELDGDRGLLRVHCDRTLGLRTDPCNLVWKTARLLGFLEHPLLSVSENGLVLDVLPINDEGETAEELTHSRNERTTDGLLNETRRTDVGNHDMDARLAAMLFVVNGGTCLFHDLDLRCRGNREKLLCLFHLGLEKVHDLLLRVLVLENVLGLNEVEIHAKLSDGGRLFREMQWTLIVFNMLHIQLLEFIHAILRNEEGPRRSPEGGVRKHTPLLNATVFEELGEAHLCYHPTISCQAIHFKRTENGTKTLEEDQAEMKFCPDCHNMLYAMAEGQLKCRSCTYSEPIPTIVYEHDLEAKTSARLSINPYIVNDPTLPRFTHMNCYNPECPTYSGTPRDVVGVKEDAVNLRWA